MNETIYFYYSTLLLVACDPASNQNRIVGELASDRVELTAELAEPITEVLVAEGEAVSAGQSPTIPER